MAGAVAAIELFDCPCIIFDIGTATTISVLDADASMLGGVIIPGPGIALEALTARSALLSSVSLEAPKHVIGSNTADCMRSGSVYGTASMMDGMCDRIEEELGKKCSIVATGGLGKEIVPHCRRNIVYCDNLLLEGLRILYEKNTGKAGR